jgi:hypothetical protein
MSSHRVHTASAARSGSTSAAPRHRPADDTSAPLGPATAQALIVTSLDQRAGPAITLGLRLGDTPVRDHINAPARDARDRGHP